VNLDASAGAFWRGMGIAFAASVASMWLGIVFGNWIKKLQR
jgi:hypothetical protein